MFILLFKLSSYLILNVCRIITVPYRKDQEIAYKILPPLVWPFRLISESLVETPVNKLVRAMLASTLYCQNKPDSSNKTPVVEIQENTVIFSQAKLYEAENSVASASK